jgi:hypothetical protein
VSTTPTLAHRQREMHERNTGSHNGAPTPRNGVPMPEPRSPATERHYQPFEIAKLWGISYTKVVNIFENEPGVLVAGGHESKVPRPGKKRRRMFLRIPESVMERKHRELVNK